MNYFDDFGFVHDKKINESRKYPCNDQLFLTAILNKLSGYSDYKINFFSSLPHLNGLPLVRSPETDVNPSRDFYLGCAWLGLDYAKIMKENGWKFPIAEIPRFNAFKTISSFILAMGEDKKFLWRKDLRHSYRFLFLCPLQDREFYYRMSGEKCPTIYRLIAWIDRKIEPKTNSAKFIRFLKYDYQPSLSDWLEKCNGFEDHVLYIAAKNKAPKYLIHD